jgi:hypothetical protein
MGCTLISPWRTAMARHYIRSQFAQCLFGDQADQGDVSRRSCVIKRLRRWRDNGQPARVRLN